MEKKKFNRRDAWKLKIERSPEEMVYTLDSYVAATYRRWEDAMRYLPGLEIPEPHRGLLEEREVAVEKALDEFGDALADGRFDELTHYYAASLHKLLHWDIAIIRFQDAARKDWLKRKSL